MVRLADLIRNKPAGAVLASHGKMPGGSPAPPVRAAAGNVPAAAAPPAGAARELADGARTLVDKTLATLRAGGRLDLAPLAQTASALVASLEVDDALLAIALDPRPSGGDLARHMVNVAIFALKIGMSAGRPREELAAVALAGLVHDVGLLALPATLAEKAGNLSSEEIELLRQHPEKGASILRAAGPEYHWLATLVAQEHEREDGSGYPKGLRGDEIQALAKLLGIADAYESLTHPRPFRRRVSPLDAVKEIITSERRAFPDWALKALIRGLSTFPVGSLVRLNSKEIGRVVGTNPAYPLRPVVEMVAGPSGEPLTSQRVVDLSQNSLLHITDSYAAEE